MPATITRASLTRGRGYAIYGGANLFMREKIDLKFAPAWNPVNTSMFGDVDDWKGDDVQKITIKLWGAWENLGILFPSYILNPVIGGSIFGSAGPDVPLHIQGDNGDYITYPNAAVTKVADLYLGVDEDIWSADVEFTALIANPANPEDAGAFHTRGTNAYSDATANFSKANYKRVRFTAAWGAFAGFGAITPAKGIKCSWAADLVPQKVDGLGTRDMSMGPKGMTATAKMIPLGPSLAQLKAESNEEAAYGTLASSISGDLICTGNGGAPIITLKNAYLMDNGVVFDASEYRVGEATWRTTRGFAGGVPNIISSVA